MISARYLRALHLRAEAFTDSEDDAQAITEKTSAFLSLFHAAEGSVGAQGTDPDVKAFFDSLKVEQSGDRAILTATVPARIHPESLDRSSARNRGAGRDGNAPQAAARPDAATEAQSRDEQ